VQDSLGFLARDIQGYGERMPFDGDDVQLVTCESMNEATAAAQIQKSPVFSRA
jgi:hypothetical protein